MNPIIEASAKQWGLPYTKTSRDPWREFTDALTRKRTQKKLDFYASRVPLAHPRVIYPNPQPY